MDIENIEQNSRQPQGIADEIHNADGKSVLEDIQVVCQATDQIACAHGLMKRQGQILQMFIDLRPQIHNCLIGHKGHEIILPIEDDPFE